MLSEAKNSNNLVYNTSSEHETIQSESEKGGSDSPVTLKDMFGPMYMKVFLIGCILSLVQQLTGINAVVFFSTDLFKGEGKGLDAEKAARIGTVIFGSVNMASALSSTFLL